MLRRVPLVGSGAVRAKRASTMRSFVVLSSSYLPLPFNDLAETENDAQHTTRTGQPPHAAANGSRRPRHAPMGRSHPGTDSDQCAADAPAAVGAFPGPGHRDPRSVLCQVSALQCQRRAPGHGLPLGRGACLELRGQLPAVQRCGQQPHRALGRGHGIGHALAPAGQLRQRQHTRPARPARDLRRRGHAAHRAHRAQRQDRGAGRQLRRQALQLAQRHRVPLRRLHLVHRPAAPDHQRLRRPHCQGRTAARRVPHRWQERPREPGHHRSAGPKRTVLLARREEAVRGGEPGPAAPPDLGLRGAGRRPPRQPQQAHRCRHAGRRHRRHQVRRRRQHLGRLGLERHCGRRPGHPGQRDGVQPGRQAHRPHPPARALRQLGFGGADNNRLFMASSHSLYALYVNTRGAEVRG